MIHFPKNVKSTKCTSETHRVVQPGDGTNKNPSQRGNVTAAAGTGELIKKAHAKRVDKK
jgi:hypothetical protein